MSTKKLSEEIITEHDCTSETTPTTRTLSSKTQAHEMAPAVKRNKKAPAKIDNRIFSLFKLLFTIFILYYNVRVFTVVLRKKL